MSYAEKTTVSAESSRSEIERTLLRYGADQFMYGWDNDRAVIQFRAQERFVRFVVTMPDRNDKRFTHYQRGTTVKTMVKRVPNEAVKAWEQATRQRWRALALVVKAKLEAVEAGISEFEDEFLAHIVLPDGQTAGEWLRPQIASAYELGTMPSFMPALGPGKDT